MFGSSLSALQGARMDLGALASRGLQAQVYQPAFVPQTSFGMMAEFTNVFNRLATQLRNAERGARRADEACGEGEAPDEGTKAKRLKSMVAEATIILGHKIPTKDIEIFNMMVQEGYMASVSLLLDVVEAGRLDDMVYQAYLARLRRSQEGRIELERAADGSEQWQISGTSTDGHYCRPLEEKRYEPEHRDAFEQLLAQLR